MAPYDASPPPTAKQLTLQHKANIWTARIIPFALMAAAAYASYVFIGIVCINHVIQREKKGVVAGILLALYMVLLFLMAISFFRVLGCMWANPGFVERGPAQVRTSPESIDREHRPVRRPRRHSQHSRKSNRNSKRHSRQSSSVGSAVIGGDEEKDMDSAPHLPGELSLANPHSNPPIPGAAPLAHIHSRLDPSPSGPLPLLAPHYDRDIFICENHGTPIWCTSCQNYKPDRTHHCREVGRCVERMDHFCPWAGGVVSLTSHKFFTLFLCYTFIYCLYVDVVCGIYLTRIAYWPSTSSALDGRILAVLVIGGFFGLFSIGMACATLQLVFLNVTTLENFSRKVKVYQIALHDPDYDPRNITPTSYPRFKAPGTSGRYFLITSTKPGTNPWDLGWKANFCELMGYHWWEWFNPWMHSPCYERVVRREGSSWFPIRESLKEQLWRDIRALEGPIKTQ